MKIYCIATRVFILGLVLINYAHAQDRSALHFSVQASSSVPSLTHGLETRVRITNVSQQPIYVYDHWEMLVNSWASTIAGKDLNKELTQETMPPPPARDSYVPLKPGTFKEDLRHDSLTDLGIHKPGRYRITFTYNPRFAREFKFGLPVWTGWKDVSMIIDVVE